MKMFALLALLAAALALWAFGLRARGFFSGQTTSPERQAYGVRAALWIASIVIVSWPLQLYRATIGDTAYVIAALSILALSFGLGLVATKHLAKRSKARRGGA